MLTYTQDLPSFAKALDVALKGTESPLTLNARMTQPLTGRASKRFPAGPYQTEEVLLGVLYTHPDDNTEAFRQATYRTVKFAEQSDPFSEAGEALGKYHLENAGGLTLNALVLNANDFLIATETNQIADMRLFVGVLYWISLFSAQAALNTTGLPRAIFIDVRDRNNPKAIITLRERKL